MDVRGLDETWQADLVEMIPYARENGGYKYLLTCIDILSKYAWTVPVKSKTGKDIAEAMKSILSKGQRVPKHLHTDRGKEFYNKDFEAVMNKYRIHLYSTYATTMSVNIERLACTSTSHAQERERYILKTKFAQRVGSVSRKFKIGDKVRVSKAKHLFEKGYEPNWTTEVFTVRREVAPTDPVTTYHLQDYYLEQPISGCFYEEELSKAKHTDVYLVEKSSRDVGIRLMLNG
ncbi:unnamed protein product [Trichogramma brassicae]|uniref:Integrase catalytic domain-containing protein n=1 Tax=Trichogramma brassicae TaxID=86971 RepID=A0A6H5IJ55_9HYME|nr:unnamed protein product [Trichogramma brassicae]